MVGTTEIADPPIRLMKTPLCILITALTAGLLASCKSSAPGKPEKKPIGPVYSALQSGNWQRVQTKPPTYFPKGIPADHPTDYRDGFWVNSGDSQGSRFFIPARGSSISQEQLIAEAMEAMTPEAREELKRQGKGNFMGDITSKTVGGVSKVFGGAASAVGKVGRAIPGVPSKSKEPSAPPASTELPDTEASSQ